MTLPMTRFAYVLDIDGTLVDLADTPGAVTLHATLPGLVEALYQSSGGAIALITGRSIADADRLFSRRRLPIAGQHGHERRSADGRVTRHRVSPKVLDPGRFALRSIVERHPKLILEDKGLSLALHYRRAPHLASLAHRMMRDAQGLLGDQYAVHRGKRVVELTPTGKDKGLAIRAFTREAPFRGRRAVFIGDDVTDEHGFAMVNRLGGDSIKVGAGPAAASWRLPSVPAVLAWLDTGRRGRHAVGAVSTSAQGIVMPNPPRLILQGLDGYKESGKPRWKALYCCEGLTAVQDGWVASRPPSPPAFGYVAKGDRCL